MWLLLWPEGKLQGEHGVRPQTPSSGQRLPAAGTPFQPHGHNTSRTGPVHSLPNHSVWCYPKKSKPGKWRLIVDLSSPTNASVNDGINKDMCSISIDQVSHCILNLGLGTLINGEKVDIKSAYRIVPVHPDDRYLLSACAME